MEGRSDWQAVEGSREFEQLTAARRRVVVPLLAVFVVWFGGYLILTAYAHHFMGESIYRGFTVGYLLALSQIVMAWVLAWIYMRASTRQLEPRRERATRVATGEDTRP
jgi:uncharacterized membrane protein (DUF485 family)